VQEFGTGKVRTETVRDAIPGDDRSFLVRTFKTDEGPGIARAFLSDRYSVMDNLDVLMASLDGIREAGVKVDVAGCDLSERRMYVRLVSPEVQVSAVELLKDYRSPFSGQSGADLPIISAGLLIQNSEVGNGAFSLS